MPLGTTHLPHLHMASEFLQTDCTLPGTSYEMGDRSAQINEVRLSRRPKLCPTASSDIRQVSSIRAAALMRAAFRSGDPTHFEFGPAFARFGQNKPTRCVNVIAEAWRYFGNI